MKPEYELFRDIARRLLALSVLISLAVPCAAQTEFQLKEQPGAAASLGYETVAEALDALKKRADASIEVTKPDGWTIVTVTGQHVVWSFTPEGHYAHPAVVRRAVKQANGVVYVETTALCQAAKEPCDRLMREFQQLDQQMRESMRKPAGPGAGP